MMVRTVEIIAARLGLATVTEDGSNRFGGHVFRVSGARHLAGLGLPQESIMLMARWRSAIVLHYIREAPLQAMTAEYRARRAGHLAESLAAKRSAETAARDVEQTSASLRPTALELQSVIDQVTRLTEAHAKLENELLQKFDTWACERSYILNERTHAWHLARSSAAEATSGDRTRCGFAYQQWRFRRAGILPRDVPWWRLCERCLGPARSERRAGSHGRDPTDSHDDVEE